MISLKCKTCGKEFSVRNYRKKTAKFCNRKCVMPKDAGWNRGTKGIMKPNMTSFKKGIVPWNKGTKGIVKAWNKGIKGVLKANSGSFKKGERRSPATEFKKGSCGELSLSWQGGKTQGQKKRMLQKYKDWRIAVYKRDDFTCVVCGGVGRNLNAHHIKEWANFPGLRLDIDNGVTMCEDCHKLYHKNKRKRK